jgi:hypothetical protein
MHYAMLTTRHCAIGYGVTIYKVTQSHTNCSSAVGTMYVAVRSVYYVFCLRVHTSPSSAPPLLLLPVMPNKLASVVAVPTAADVSIGACC